MRLPRRRIVAITEGALASLAADQWVALPDMEDIEYPIARRPTGAHLRAWAKLEEAERRLIVHRWLVQITDPAQPQYHTLLDDSETAFLLAFEATLQFVNDQFRNEGAQPDFGEWLRDLQRGRDTLVFRGIRTLRHLEAHVRAALPPAIVTVHANGHTQLRITREWQLSPLTATHLKRLDRPQLAPTDLDAWNQLVQATAGDELMGQGLKELAYVVHQAELRA